MTYHPTSTVISQIIILYAFYTHRRIKSKFPNHINSIYLNNIYEEIIHQFSYVVFVLIHKRLCYHGGLETVDSQHIDSETFPKQHGTLTKCWFNVGQRCSRWSSIKTTLGQFFSRRWSNIKTTLGQFFVSVVSCNLFSR